MKSPQIHHLSILRTSKSLSSLKSTTFKLINDVLLLFRLSMTPKRKIIVPISNDFTCKEKRQWYIDVYGLEGMQYHRLHSNPPSVLFNLSKEMKSPQIHHLSILRTSKSLSSLKSTTFKLINDVLLLFRL